MKTPQALKAFAIGTVLATTPVTDFLFSNNSTAANAQASDIDPNDAENAYRNAKRVARHSTLVEFTKRSLRTYSESSQRNPLFELYALAQTQLMADMFQKNTVGRFGLSFCFMQQTEAYSGKLMERLSPSSDYYKSLASLRSFASEEVQNLDQKYDFTQPCPEVLQYNLKR